MLTTLRLSGAHCAVPGDAVADLLACHDRIRRFVAMAARLADAPSDAPAAQIAETAASVARYFSVALPLHAADEDESIRPRLAAASVSAEVRRRLDVMTAEHEPIEALIVEATPLWQAVAAQPARLVENRRDLDLVAVELEVLFRRHLPPEEEVIFPALHRHLTPLALEAVRAEMRRRRV
jgi:hemerythrin-like domain-containing protein